MKSPPTEPWIPILFTVLLLLGLGIAVGIAGQVKLVNNPIPTAMPQTSVGPSSSPAPAGSIKFGGTLTADGCVTSQLPVGDVGCSVTLNDKYTVEVEHGNAYANQPWGTLVGFPAYPKSPVGSSVEVYAHQLNQTNFTLEGSTAYYVKIAN